MTLRRLLLTLLVLASLLLAGCAAEGNPGGATGSASITATVDFETTCTDGDCTVAATLASSDGTDRAVHVRVYDAENRTAMRTVHTFTDPGERVGDRTEFSVPEGTVLVVVLQRDGSSEVSQQYTVEPSR